MGLFDKLRGKRRPDQLFGRVIFAASSAAVARMDIRLGPCVQSTGAAPRAGRRIASLWWQHPDPIESVEALFQVLAGDTGGPWATTIVEVPGELHELRPEFVEALASLLRTSSEADPDHPSLAPYREAAARWLEVAEWPRRPTIDGLVGRLLVDAAEAADAQRLRRTLYCWHGPLVLDGVDDGRTGRQILEMRGEY